MKKRLPQKFYQRNDVTLIARELLGKVLCTHDGRKLTSGMITEVEAYGRMDKACHAYNGKRTPRTETMFLPGGNTYVYLCYGIHSLFNIVTNKKDVPEAVLIRSIEALDGIETILARRKHAKIKTNTTSGPGIVSSALGITRSANAEMLPHSERIWVEDRGFTFATSEITSTTRIGIDYAEEDALLPWRFYLSNSPFVSKR